jgi:hypothetical protein
MPVTLQGSCRCAAVRFSVESHTPYPYQLCYCSICRKVGGSGYAINIMGDHASLRVEGGQSVGTFQAQIVEDGRSYTGPCLRHFCTRCGTMLWVHDDDWPDLVHPFASAIDTALPEPPVRVHMMLEAKPAWVAVTFGPGDQRFGRYPDQSIEDWHRSRGLWID